MSVSIRLVLSSKMSSFIDLARKTNNDVISQHLTRLPSYFWIIAVLCSLLLICLSINKASTFPFTHDESLSFAIFTSQPSWAKSANNHVLNTRLMEITSRLFGSTEVSLRLPNIIALGIYLTFTLLILKRLQNTLLRFAGFILIHLNLYCFDFFSLARGYGLALAFTSSSLYLLILFYENRQQYSFSLYMLMSSGLAAVAVLSNFAFINYYLSLLTVTVVMFLFDFRFDAKKIISNIKFLGYLLINGIFVSTFVVILFDLQRRGELYFGGKEGFFKDTIGSLVKVSFYSVPHSPGVELFVKNVVVALYVVFSIAWVGFLIKRRTNNLFVLFSSLLLCVSLLPVAQHLLFQSLFPVERASLFYIPLFMFVLLFGLNSILGALRNLSWKILILSIPVGMAIFTANHFYRGFKLTYCYSWGYDARNKDVLDIVNIDRKEHFNDAKSVKMAVNWLMEPSLNYYRITRNYFWLDPLTRDPVEREKNNYVYVTKKEIAGWPVKSFDVLAYFSDTNTILLRMHGERSLNPK